MDTIEQYRQCIERVMRGYQSFGTSQKGVEAVLIIDADRSHFLLMYVGWDGWRRVHHVAVHVEVRGDKVWLQCDNTDLVVAEDLVAEGIPKQSIVLGFREPEIRKHTEYAVG
ncbi:MAG TPA: XisI protein [Kofleriaceae bacterium]|nr:XisI protein [Kofleriaceae bacterium]